MRPDVVVSMSAFISLKAVLRLAAVAGAAPTHLLGADQGRNSSAAKAFQTRPSSATPMVHQRGRSAAAFATIARMHRHPVFRLVIAATAHRILPPRAPWLNISSSINVGHRRATASPSRAGTAYSVPYTLSGGPSKQVRSPIIRRRFLLRVEKQAQSESRILPVFSRLRRRAIHTGSRLLCPWKRRIVVDTLSHAG